jgi:hypothetical protein
MIFIQEYRSRRELGGQVVFISRRPLLTQITAVAAMIVGLLMVIGGIGLIVALVSTPQPTLQVATCCILLAAGAVNLHCSRGIRNEQPRSVMRGALATLLFLVYSGAALRDFGELFWMSATLLLLLVALRRRSSLHPSIAA